MLNKIIEFLKKNNIDFQIIEHEAVFTSEQAAKVRGLSASEGMKSLLLKTKTGFLLVVIPGDKQLDSKRLKQLGYRDFRFAYPEEVKDVMGCEIGACYPFGSLIDVEMIVDRSFEKNDYVSFNPGVHEKTIRMKWQDYQEILKPNIEEISK